jgi:ribosomal protein L29
MATAKKPAAKTTKKATEVKDLATLQSELATKQADYLESKRSHDGGELVNPRVLTHTRKEIARMLTAINTLKASEQKESK